MYHPNKYGRAKNALALAVAVALFGCQSGHESSDDESTSTTDTSSGSSGSAITVNLPAAVTLTEPSSGSNTESITVTLSAALSQDLVLSVVTSDVTTRSEGQFKNYDPIAAQTVRVPAGVTTYSLPLNLVHNNLHEGSKQLRYTISAASNPDYTLENSSSNVTLTDSDSEPTIRFTDASKTVLEGDSAQSYIELSHYHAKEVTVNLAQSGIASSDDVTSSLSSMTVTIPAESLHHVVTVSAKKDGLIEGGESLIYTMESSGNTTIDSDHNSLAFYIPGDREINDTGFATYSNGASHDLTVEPAGYPGQDADYGLDKEDGGLHSDGQHGFKLTKLDYSGNVLANDASSWSCVRDERTGVYIEAKQAPRTLPSQGEIETWLEAFKNDPDANPYPWASESGQWRSATYRYTWYNSDSSTNGGNLGAINDLLPSVGPISSQCAFPEEEGVEYRCNAEVYLATLNSYGVCGVSNWRLPSPSEARSIVNYGFGVGPTDPTTENYFPYMKGASMGNSADTIFTSASRVTGGGASAWCMQTQTGQVELCNKGTYHGVIAVSEGVE